MGWGVATILGLRIGTAEAGRRRGEERQSSAPAGEGSAAVPLKEGAEVVFQLEDRVETCRLQGKALARFRLPQGVSGSPGNVRPPGGPRSPEEVRQVTLPTAAQTSLRLGSAEEPNPAPPPPAHPGR